MTESGSDAQVLLARLRQDYVAHLPGRRASVREAWKNLAASGWNPDVAADLHRTVHGLAGSGLSFGFRDLTDAARNAERLIQEAVGAHAVPVGPVRAEVDAALERLDDVIAKIVEQAGAQGA